MEIRYAKQQDLAAIIELEQEGFSVDEQITPAVLETYLIDYSQTCLVMEEAGAVIAHLLALPSRTIQVTDDIFTLTAGEDRENFPYLVVASLVVSAAYKGQGLGTLLLAALKELSLAQKRQGIGLTCKDSLISYYEGNGFKDGGLSASQFGGRVWYDLYWKIPPYRSI